MASSTLNNAYKRYLEDKEANLEPLLESVRNKALQITHDEDISQTVTIETWQALPMLDIRVSFNGWVKRRIEWKLKEQYRTHQPEQIPHGRDDEGTLSPEETAEYLLFKHIEHETPSIVIKNNPFIQQVADFLQMGHTQAYIANALNIEPATLRKRIERYRKNHGTDKERNQSEKTPTET